jgi:hypothetical protein
VRRCGLPARRKKKQAAARHRGRRGSRGSRRSRRRRVRLLPRAAPVFAANGSPTGGSTPPPSLLHSLLLRRVGVGGQGATPLGWLGLGVPLGLGGGLSRAARRGTSGRPGCAGARGTPRRRAFAAGAPPPLPLGVSQRRKVGVTRSLHRGAWVTRGAWPAGQQPGRAR